MPKLIFGLVLWIIGLGSSHRARAHQRLYDQIWKLKWQARDQISKHVKQDVEDQIWEQLSMPSRDQIPDLVYHEIYTPFIMDKIYVK